MAWVYVSLGSNINRYQHISASLDALSERFGALTISPVYESQSVGFDGSDFLNLVAHFDCKLTLAELVAVLRGIENDNGRRRDGPKFSPRTLDIDILTYGDCVGEFDDVLLPRDEITKNAFVLLPLMNIAPMVVHPSLGKTYQQLWDCYDKDRQKLWLVEFRWRDEDLSKL